MQKHSTIVYKAFVIFTIPRIPKVCSFYFVSFSGNLYNGFYFFISFKSQFKHHFRDFRKDLSEILSELTFTQGIHLTLHHTILFSSLNMSTILNSFDYLLHAHCLSPPREVACLVHYSNSVTKNHDWYKWCLQFSCWIMNECVQRDPHITC